MDVVLSANFAKLDVVTWILPLTSSKPSRALPIECRLSWPRRSECRLSWPQWFNSGQGRRSVREDPLVGPLHSAGWPSTGALSLLLFAAIETSLIVLFCRFYVIWSVKFDRPFWECRSKPIMGISADMDRRRSDRCIPSMCVYMCMYTRAATNDYFDNRLIILSINRIKKQKT